MIEDLCACEHHHHRYSEQMRHDLIDVQYCITRNWCGILKVSKEDVAIVLRIYRDYRHQKYAWLGKQKNISRIYTTECNIQIIVMNLRKVRVRS